jgi:hypothetical protein
MFSVFKANTEQRVVSMVNVVDTAIPNYPSLASLNAAVHGLYTPVTPAYYSPSIGISPASIKAQFSSPTPSGRAQPPTMKDKPVLVSQPAIPVAQVTGTPAVSVNTLNMTRMLTMDAETAIKHAPFVDLGRTALAQNWSCVKIGNVCYKFP